MAERGSYRTIVADPPWRYRKDGRKRVGDRSYGSGVLRWAEQHYETMSNADLAALPVRELAADDAHLYLWVTSPRLYGERNDRSISPADIADAWGFEYVSLLTWHKTGPPGLGNYFRVNTEHVLFCVRGRAPIDPAVRLPTLFAAPRTRHSEKPDLFLDLVEQVSPGPRLEMFSRRSRFGWDAWGDESLGTAEMPTRAAASSDTEGVEHGAG